MPLFGCRPAASLAGRSAQPLEEVADAGTLAPQRALCWKRSGPSPIRIALERIVIPIGDGSPPAGPSPCRLHKCCRWRRRARWRGPHVSLLSFESCLGKLQSRRLPHRCGKRCPSSSTPHGYGFFTGDHPTDLSLHVLVVRSPALDSLHARTSRALSSRAEVAGWSEPDLWTPHFTLIDRALDPRALGAAATWLARRRHPSWSIPVDRVMVTGAWPDRTGSVIALAEGR